MPTYREAQLNHVDPDENRVPQYIKIKIMSDSGSTKWLNIDYDSFEVIAGYLMVNEGEQEPYIPIFSRKATKSHDAALVSRSIETTPAIDNNGGG
jgi:hypothetical protein